MNEDLLEYAKARDARRRHLAAHLLPCLMCGEREQIQLTNHGPPAQWRCRKCRHRYTYEPPTPQTEETP